MTDKNERPGDGEPAYPLLVLVGLMAIGWLALAGVAVLVTLLWRLL